MQLVLENMSLEEKIQVMESIWDDLRARAEGALSPPWHGDILAARQSDLEQGRDEFEDWSTARDKINKQIS